MSFIFEDLKVYQKAISINENLFLFLKHLKGEYEIKDQLKRASMSIALNIAEGAGRFSKREKRNFNIIARGSIYECVAILQIMKKISLIKVNNYEAFYEEFVSLSKMLNGLINSLQ